MSTMKAYPTPANFNMDTLVHLVAQNLISRGFSCQASVMSPQSAVITVTNDNDGIKNFVGLGVECRCNITVMGGQVSVNIDSDCCLMLYWSSPTIRIMI